MTTNEIAPRGQIETTNLTVSTEVPIPVRTAPADAISRHRAWLAISALLAALAALFVATMMPRWRAKAELENSARDQRPVVSVISPERTGDGAGLVLPGSTQAIQETTINARTNGYIRRWLADIGAKVEAGQLLAEIETPEVDQELDQARANLAQAAANLELARATWRRWQELLQKKVVSAQEFDEKKSGFDARQADLNAAKANVKRLEDLQAFQKIVAPFAGIITARYIDNGTLVAAGSIGQNAALFRIAQTDPLRIFVSVPQTYARSISPGQTATVSFTEITEKTFPATVVHTTGAIDPASRTLLTDLQVPNADGQLLPGTYAEIRFALPQDGRTLVIPGNAVMIRADGAKVITVDTQHAIRYRPVKLGHDLGDRVEILSGLDTGDLLIANPNDALREGVEVKVQTPPSTQQTNAKPTEKK
jgi:RND family efflux transporter MFP subunit